MNDIQHTRSDADREAFACPEPSYGSPKSSPTLGLLISQWRFPKPIPLGERSVGWLESEVDDWIKQRIEQKRPQGM